MRRQTSCGISLGRLLICALATLAIGYYTVRASRAFFFSYSDFHPPREQIVHPAGQIGSRLQDIAFETDDGTRVEGWSLPSSNGAGESGGRADWGISSYNAVKRAMDLASKSAGIRHIALFGYSMGSFIAVQIAARELRVNALVLLAPFTNLADEIRYQFQSRVPFLNEFSVVAARMAGVPVDHMRTVDILKVTA
jgi:pimeloyl-ACP methyl ester carboxylesterase